MIILLHVFRKFLSLNVRFTLRCSQRWYQLEINSKQEHPAYCETRRRPCVLRNLWSCVIRKASCFPKPMFVYIAFLFYNIKFRLHFLALQALDSVGLKNSLCLFVSADSGIII